MKFRSAVSILARIVNTDHKDSGVRHSTATFKLSEIEARRGFIGCRQNPEAPSPRVISGICEIAQNSPSASAACAQECGPSASLMRAVY
jgi:hypothetical protein